MNLSSLHERVIPIDGQQKKTVAIHISRSDGKGTYPARRAAMITKPWLTKQISYTYAERIPLQHLRDLKQFRPPSNALFLQALASIKPDLLLRDSGSTIQEEIEKIAELVPSIIHFDDFGDGGKCADLVFQTLYVESNDKVPRSLRTWTREFHC